MVCWRALERLQIPRPPDSEFPVGSLPFLGVPEKKLFGRTNLWERDSSSLNGLRAILEGAQLFRQIILNSGNAIRGQNFLF